MSIDLRPVNENKLIRDIPFAQESPIEDRESDQTHVRTILELAGVKIGTDIGALGCTGLVHWLSCKGRVVYLDDAKFVRSHMDGSGLGLPCYVPDHLFCLVHNTIGALDGHGVGHYPEGVALCSRDLTDPERLHSAAVQVAIAEEGKKNLKERFGVEPVKETIVETPRESKDVNARFPLELNDNFRCPEHTKPVWQCRYCIAEAIIHGPFTPDAELTCTPRVSTSGRVETQAMTTLDEQIASNKWERIDLMVCVASWRLQLVREE